MSKNLVIVESPAKAKTIEKYLGSDFVVKSSMGHIRALPSKNGSVDVDNDFKPVFEVDPAKRKVISELKKASKTAEQVWLASDEDREGEAIAWHLAEVLGLDTKTTKRIVFHEITKSALDEAVKSPRTIDDKLVQAQQARQSLDYLVGFELSPVLWRKVAPKLSAGRVQSVAVRLIVEREKEIKDFKPEITFKLQAIFKLKDGSDLVATCPTKFKSTDEAKRVLEDYAKSTFAVADISKKPATRSPSAPFTTSTLQQEASSKIGYSPRQTMQLAQRLYEAGHITYMRTDSVNLSNNALGAMTNFIKKEYGDKYHQFRTYKSKSAGAQEAHEAIRPTDVSKTKAGADSQQEKLYNLIWRRTLASQMAPAQLEKSTMHIKASSSDESLEAKGEIVVFDGFLKVYGRSGDDTLLPALQSGDKLVLSQAEATEVLSRAPARYTEASLVRKLEEMGIGRPSTYAPTIGTIQTRGYVERADVEGEEKQITKLVLRGGSVNESKEPYFYGKDTNKLIPTDTGKVVTDFLVKFFAEVMEYDFTKQVEEELDDIADGKKDRVTVLKHFYEPFHKLIEASGEITRKEASQARLIGMDPNGKQPIYARFGRFGPMLQRGEQSDDPKPTFAPLPSGKKIEDVSLDEALQMFKLPRVVGKTEEGEEIVANIGRFGPYVKVGSTFVSIKPLDPFTIDVSKSRELYKEKLAGDKKKNIKQFDSGIKVLVGPFGPYITDGKKNARIPKDQKPEDLTEEQCKELLEKAPSKKRRNFKRKT